MPVRTSRASAFAHCARSPGVAFIAVVQGSPLAITVQVVLRSFTPVRADEKDAYGPCLICPQMTPIWAGLAGAVAARVRAAMAATIVPHRITLRFCTALLPNVRICTNDYPLP